MTIISESKDLKTPKNPFENIVSALHKKSRQREKKDDRKEVIRDNFLSENTSEKIKIINADIKYLPIKNLAILMEFPFFSLQKSSHEQFNFSGRSGQKISLIPGSSGLVTLSQYFGPFKSRIFD